MNNKQGERNKEKGTRRKEQRIRNDGILEEWKNGRIKLQVTGSI